VGDFNERLGDDPNLLASICGEFDFSDVHDFHHGDSTTTPTDIRGTKRLDYCLLSPCLAPFVCVSGIDCFNECYHSDHRALFFDIDLKAYLGDILPALARPDQRFISTGSRHVTKFVAKVHSHLHANKVLHAFREYSLDADLLEAPWRCANDIDDMLGQALDTVEQACSSVSQHPWSKNQILEDISDSTHNRGTAGRHPCGTCDGNLARHPPPAPSNTYVLKKVKKAAERSLKRVGRNADVE
jgi:hypothetical protein